jgi:hypothetical protein
MLMNFRVTPAAAGEILAGPSRDLLAGTVLDFVEIEPGRHDFIFVPPVAGSGCGVAQPGPVNAGDCGSGGCAGCSR